MEDDVVGDTPLVCQQFWGNLRRRHFGKAVAGQRKPQVFRYSWFRLCRTINDLHRGCKETFFYFTYAKILL